MNEPLPPAVTERWIEWTSSLEMIKGSSVPRCLKPKDFGVTRCAELHHFADASESGYGSVSYIRQVNKQSIAHVTFVLGKSRVLPLKNITVPRLELAAAALLVKVDRMLRREFHLDLKPSVFWTDSQTVLKYLANDQARFKTYVANRVSLIRDNTELSQWRYVGTKDNPADDSSRGLSARKFLEQRRWIHAREFLWRPEESWPLAEALGPMFQDDPEVRRATTVYTAVIKPETPTDQLISFFSNWIRLLKAVAWYLRLKTALRLIVKRRKDLFSSQIHTHSTKQRWSFKLVDFRHHARGKAGEQKMADLPLERILPDLPPFTNVGLDYFGPIEVRRGRSAIKRYGVIFTCMSSRAVHLEIAYTLDTDSCIHALRRFICRRGQVKHIRSDNGTNLVGAHAKLKKALMSLNERKIQDALLPDGIEWSFNPPAASHYGGVWERLIRSVRQVLNSTLHQQCIDNEGLHTLFCETEAILNNRPLSTVSSDLP